MAPPKKQATKGQKQIYEENTETIKWYTYMAIGTMVIYCVLILFFSPSSLASFTAFWLPTIFSLTVYVTCLQLMLKMAKPVLGPTGQVVDGGIDLNMEKGFAENFKDAIILTSIVQILSIYSNNFWYLWLGVPCYGFYLLWVKVLGPWFFAAPTEEQQQVDEKKQKKLERRAKRGHN